MKLRELLHKFVFFFSTLKLILAAWDAMPQEPTAYLAIRPLIPICIPHPAGHLPRSSWFYLFNEVIFYHLI